MVRALAVTLVALGEVLARDLPDHILHLARVKAKVQDSLKTLPDYTCLAITDRFEQRLHDPAAHHVDIVRMEVAHSGHADLYAWPGAAHFDSSSGAELIGAGMYGSGEFATHLSNLFGGYAVIKYEGESDVAGRKLWRWQYSISQAFDRWLVSYGSRKTNAGEKGWFWVDPRTFDITRLEVHSDGLPPNFPITEVQTIIDYAPVRIGERTVRLPQSAMTTTVEGFSGTRKQNYTEFSHCRQYVTQSEVRYGVEPPPDTEDVRPSAGTKETAIAEGLKVPIALTTEVQSQGTALGDLIEAVVTSDVAHKNQIAIPQGAVLRGRLRRMDIEPGPPEHFVIGLEFTDLEYPGYHARFFGRLDRIETPFAGARWLIDSPIRVRREKTNHGIDVITTGTGYRLPHISGVGVFFIEGNSFCLPKGLAMTWVTEAVARK